MAVTDREEAIAILRRSQQFLQGDMTWADAKEELKAVGSQVGYTPAFRCLVMGQAPEDSVRWGRQ